MSDNFVRIMCENAHVFWFLLPEESDMYQATYGENRCPVCHIFYPVKETSMIPIKTYRLDIREVIDKKYLMTAINSDGRWVRTSRFVSGYTMLQYVTRYHDLSYEKMVMRLIEDNYVDENMLVDFSLPVTYSPR